MEIGPSVLVALVLALTGAVAAAQTDDSPEPLISVSLAGDRLDDVIARLHKQYGYEIARSTELDGGLRASQVYVASAPASQAFAIVAAAYGACARTMERVVVIRPCNLLIRPAFDPEIGPMKVQLGIVIENVVAEDSKTGAAGVRVADVFKDGPANKAGLTAGDVIVSYNGQVITESPQLRRLVAGTDPGSTVPVAIMRGAERIELTARF